VIVARDAKHFIFIFLSQTDFGSNFYVQTLFCVGINS
jgi:hypothetical protein